MLLDDALARRRRSSSGEDGPIVDVGSGRRHARDSPRRVASRPGGHPARGRAPQVRRSSSAGRRSFRTSASSGDEPRSSRSTQYGVAVAKALAPPPVAAEWCLPLVREGGAVVLWVGPSADRAGASRRSPSASRPRPEPAPTGFVVLRKIGPTPPGFPRRAGCRAGSGRSPERLLDARAAARKRPASRLACERVPARSSQSRTRRAASARRRPPSTSPPASPRPASAACSSTSTRRRTRRRGSGRARERPLDARPARRRPAARARDAELVREPRPRPGEAGARRGDRAPLGARGRRALPRRRARATSATRGLRVRLPRLPAVVRPAHGQRARRRRQRDRPRAGGVLRARGPLAAARLDRPRQAAAQPAARRSPGSC